MDARSDRIVDRTRRPRRTPRSRRSRPHPAPRWGCTGCRHTDGRPGPWAHRYSAAGDRRPKVVDCGSPPGEYAQFSNNAPPMPWATPPITWPSTIFGLISRPPSWDTAVTQHRDDPGVPMDPEDHRVHPHGPGHGVHAEDRADIQRRAGCAPRRPTRPSPRRRPRPRTGRSGRSPRQPRAARPPVPRRVR